MITRFLGVCTGYQAKDECFMNIYLVVYGATLIHYLFMN